MSTIANSKHEFEVGWPSASSQEKEFLSIDRLDKSWCSFYILFSKNYDLKYERSGWENASFYPNISIGHLTCSNRTIDLTPVLDAFRWQFRKKKGKKEKNQLGKTFCKNLKF